MDTKDFYIFGGALFSDEWMKRTTKWLKGVVLKDNMGV
jgi:hypothetical protein